jgi:hypothetical protein
MSALSPLLDDLNNRNYRVSWASTLDAPGLFVPAHRLVVLAADRSESVLVEVVRDVLQRIASATH